MKKFSQRKALPPSCALLAQVGERKETMTWCMERGQWKCVSATGVLAQFRKSISPALVQNWLRQKKIQWLWIVPLFTTPITPPFKA
jgi:late competence protein required for DNA uptake (superfamily II DNA/RNA helicase)